MAMLGSHLRVCDYIKKFGTDKQKITYLPKLARGEYICAHANNERNGKVPAEWDTILTEKNGNF
jgi:alkylation response protein AidB-like acyl-CoA dehydrogenase